MVLACGLASEESRPTRPPVETCVCALASQLFGELQPNWAKRKRKKKRRGFCKLHENRLLKKGEGACECLD